MADLVTVAEALTYLGLPEDAGGRVAQLVPLITADVEALCKRSFTETVTGEVEYLDGDVAELALAKRPVSAVTEVMDAADGTVVPAEDYDLEPATGLLFRKEATLLPEETESGTRQKRRWAAGRRRWKVTYNHGVSAAPADVKLAALMLVAARVNRPDAAVSMETLGDQSKMVGVTGTGLPREVARILSRYAEVAF